jgi:hypothetical protein
MKEYKHVEMKRQLSEKQRKTKWATEELGSYKRRIQAESTYKHQIVLQEKEPQGHWVGVMALKKEVVEQN